MKNVSKSNSSNNHITIKVNKGLTPTTASKEKFHQKPKDSDVVSVHVASTEVSSDIKGDLDCIEVKKISQDDIETEILPLKNMKKDGEESDEDAPLPEAFHSLIIDADLEEFDLNHIINHSHENGFFDIIIRIKI